MDGQFNVEPDVATVQGGCLSCLREIVCVDEARKVAGVMVSPKVATIMLAIHDDLNPYEQEIFAANCGVNFQACAAACLLAHNAVPIAKLLVGMAEAHAEAPTEV